MLNLKMTNKNTKYIAGLLIAGIMIFMILSFVSALGVSCSYSKDTPLEMYPGEEKIVFLTLQNSDKEGEVDVKGEILEGSEIASLDKTSFKVSYQSITTSAKLKIKVPANANVGAQYPIVYEFNSEPGEEVTEGAVSVSFGVKRSFNVMVVEKPAEPEVPQTEEGSPIGLIMTIIIVLVIIVFLGYLFLKKKK